MNTKNTVPVAQLSVDHFFSECINYTVPDSCNATAPNETWYDWNVSCNGYDNEGKLSPTDVCLPMMLDTGNGTYMNVSHIISCDTETWDYYYGHNCSGLFGNVPSL